MEVQCLLVQFIILVLTLGLCCSTYLTEEHIQKTQGKTNKINKSAAGPVEKRYYGPYFKNDWDVYKYLKIFGRDMMIWKCKNTVQPYWNWKPIRFVELHCEAIGSMRAAAWYHDGQRIYRGGRYRNYIMPHYSYGRYYSRWIDFRLRIYNATVHDSGQYTFRLTSPSGFYEEHKIYVDISNKKKRNNNSWM